MSRPRALAFLALLGLSSSGCSADSYLDSRRADVEARLAVLKRAGQSATAHAPPTASVPVPGTKEPVVVCPLSRGLGVVSGCNTIVVYAPALIDPAHWFAETNGAELADFGHGSVVGHAAQLLESGELVSMENAHGNLDGTISYETVRRKQGVSGIRNWLNGFESVRYVFVMRPTSRNHLATRPQVFSVEAFLYDAQTGADLGGMALEASCTSLDKVFVNGPNAGKYAGSTNCMSRLPEREFEAQLAKRFPSATIRH